MTSVLQCLLEMVSQTVLPWSNASVELMLLYGKHQLLHHHCMLGLKILLSNVKKKSTVLVKLCL